MNEYMGQYVYFITDDHDHVKIGVSSGYLNGRISQLQTGNPFKLRAYQQIFAIHGEHIQIYDLEKTFHKKFEKYRLEGEWFRFDPVKEYLDWLKKICDETPKKNLRNVTNMTVCFPNGKQRDFFIYGKYRTSSTKETILNAEWVQNYF